MSQTFYDYSALEQLLEERERDLELAARIGQTLLEKNRQLADQVAELEAALESFNEENTQLKHSLQLKDELIKGNEEECLTGPSTPSVSGRIYRGGYTVQEHVTQLEERINRLQVENCELRQEIEVTVNKLSDREVEYHELVDGTVSDYHTVTRKLQIFRQELSNKSQECFGQQEQISRLLTQLVDAQREKKEIQMEAEENLNAFDESQQTQMILLAEFTELEKRYLETVRMLEDSQNANKLLNENIGEKILDDTFGTEFSTMVKTDESGIFDSSRDIVTNTLEHLRRNSQLNLDNSLQEVHCGIPLADQGTQIYPEPDSTPPHPPIASGAVTPIYSPSTKSSMMSSGMSTPLIGKAGVPGSRDLERALHRLAKRRNLENRMREERKTRVSRYRKKLHAEHNITDHSSPYHGKLQIIKTMEGSPLMRQWRYMAQIDLDTAVSQIATQQPDSPETVRHRTGLRPNPIGESAEESFESLNGMELNKPINMASSPVTKKQTSNNNVNSPSTSTTTDDSITCAISPSCHSILPELNRAANTSSQSPNFDLALLSCPNIPKISSLSLYSALKKMGLVNSKNERDDQKSTPV